LSQVGERASGPDGKLCPVVWMYSAGFNVVTDCEIGTMLRHSGGLPGFGSQVLLLPQFNIGIFAFANLTYAHLVGPVVDAAARLKRAGLLSIADNPVSPALQHAASVALRIYQSGDVGAERAELSANALLDHSAPRRNEEMRRYREQTGACSSITPLEILHPGAGRFSLACEHGTLSVAILLAPTPTPEIQYLEFTLPPPPSSRR
jgi:D-alanyl-D-alanine-carboxypeptidase/D-alanyl-D-alanine-endopeptidase